MSSGTKEIHYSRMMEFLKANTPSNWQDISNILVNLEKDAPPNNDLNQENDWEILRSGVAFWTFDFGIDGVSIEIAKYAQSLQELNKSNPAEVHFIAGDFHPQADNVLKNEWQRYQIKGVNGWDKWDDGKWFSHLFYQDMEEDSHISQKIAVEIWNQAILMAEKLGSYLVENDISLLIPVNVNSNPGNMATALCTVLVSELLGIYVLNSNHDFYWEGGKPAAERESGEDPGPRDKFFHNWQNQPFFSLLKMIYPWNGRRWIQVNINQLQSKKLIEDGFPRHRVFEISTMVSDAFFRDYSIEEIMSVRQRMAYILSDGHPVVQTVAAKSFLQGLEEWMKDQKPLVCSARDDQKLDLVSDQIHYLLQPTRIVDRKRIEKDWYLIASLLRDPSFREDFIDNDKRQIVLHITGPAPIEHRADLESVLNAYLQLLAEQPDPVARRIFMALSIGTEDHPSFSEKKFKKLTIEDIYHLASVIVFPSQTEGRGLPIIESSAAGIPIICSRYYPEEIFDGVVGKSLPEEFQIRYVPFPENEISDPIVGEIASFLLDLEKRKADNLHNIKATQLRYGRKMMRESFIEYLDQLTKE